MTHASRGLRAARGIALSLAPLLSSPLAWAAPTGRAHDTAVRLYKEGSALARQGDCAAAMPKLEESIKAEPGVGAYLTLGDCLSEGRQLAEAWRSYKRSEALAIAKKDKREVDARAAAARVEVGLFRVIVRDVERGTDGVEFTLDGAAIGARELLDGTFVEPGRHDVAATRGDKKWKGAAAGNARETIDLRVTWGEPAPVVVALPPPVSVPPPIAVAPPTPKPVAATPPPTPESPPQRTDGRSTQATVGLVSGGVGIASVAVASVFGALAFKKHGDVTSACGPAYPKSCADLTTASSARDAGVTDANLSTAFFIAGGALFGAGAVLYFTAPSAADLHVAPTVGRAGAGLSVGGSW